MASGMWARTILRIIKTILKTYTKVI
eukprot:SAG31_NODE_29755_length_390_cov_0.893471_1_plen_25_part_01